MIILRDYCLQCNWESLDSHNILSTVDLRLSLELPFHRAIRQIFEIVVPFYSSEFFSSLEAEVSPKKRKVDGKVEILFRGCDEDRVKSVFWFRNLIKSISFCAYYCSINL